MDPVLVEAGTEARLEESLWRRLPLVVSRATPFEGRLTAMAEFALATLVPADSAAGGCGWGRRVAEWLAEAYREADMARSLVSIPGSAAAHALIGECLWRWGLNSGETIGALRRALRQRFELPVGLGWRLERAETRYLDYRLARATGETTTEEPLDFSWPRAWGPKHHRETYELTHAVFFLSDFGCYGWAAGRAALESHRAALLSGLERAARLCLRHELWDLAGQIALAELCLGEPALAEPLLAALLAAQWRDGTIPPWSGAHRVRDLCHSTLVALVAFRVKRWRSGGAREIQTLLRSGC